MPLGELPLKHMLSRTPFGFASLYLNGLDAHVVAMVHLYNACCPCARMCEISGCNSSQRTAK
jgi:hypothetical protein